MYHFWANDAFNRAELEKFDNEANEISRLEIGLSIIAGNHHCTITRHAEYLSDGTDMVFAIEGDYALCVPTVTDVRMLIEELGLTGKVQTYDFLDSLSVAYVCESEDEREFCIQHFTDAA